MGLLYEKSRVADILIDSRFFTWVKQVCFSAMELAIVICKFPHSHHSLLLHLLRDWRHPDFGSAVLAPSYNPRLLLRAASQTQIREPLGPVRDGAQFSLLL